MRIKQIISCEFRFVNICYPFRTFYVKKIKQNHEGKRTLILNIIKNQAAEVSAAFLFKNKIKTLPKTQNKLYLSVLTKINNKNG
jgi:hypothetical protein